MNVIEMTYDQWFDKYQPHHENDQIKYYETYGDDLSFINSVDPLNIWTMLDNKYIVNGKYFVNRLLYIVTKNSWERGEEIEVEYE